MRQLIHHIFLTGVPGVGKSTVILKVCEGLKMRGHRVGGMATREIRRGDVRVGFEIQDLLTGESGILSHVDRQVGPRVGKYRVNLDGLESIGARSILTAVREAELIVVDEVGPMELTSEAFIDAVREAFRSENRVLGTIHFRARHSLIDEIRSNPEIEVIEVTESNKNALVEKLIALLG